MRFLVTLFFRCANYFHYRRAQKIFKIRLAHEIVEQGIDISAMGRNIEAVDSIIQRELRSFLNDIPDDGKSIADREKAAFSSIIAKLRIITA